MPLFGEFGRSSRDLYRNPFRNVLSPGRLSKFFEKWRVAFWGNFGCWYDAVTTWRYDDMMIWWYGDMMIWWYGDMMIWWHDDMVIWWYDGMVIWWYGDMMIWWHGDMMILWWCDDVMIWNGDWPDSAPYFIFFPSNFDFRISAEGYNLIPFDFRFSISGN